MDYRDFVLKHRESGAAITIAALPSTEKEASAFGVMKIDGSGKVIEFAEKPKGDNLTKMRVDTTVSPPRTRKECRSARVICGALAAW